VAVADSGKAKVVASRVRVAGKRVLAVAHELAQVEQSLRLARGEVLHLHCIAPAGEENDEHDSKQRRSYRRYQVVA